MRDDLEHAYHRFGRGLWLAGILLTALFVVRGEQLPVRHYMTADGLPRDHTTLIKQDSRGFIWIATGDGISRFDGYTFRNYTTDDGLPDRRVNDLLETRAGVYWIATGAGLCRFNPTGISPSRGGERVAVQGQSGVQLEPIFVVYNPPNQEKATAFNALVEDETGVIWCATSAGLYMLKVKADGEAQFYLVDWKAQQEREADSIATALLKDRKGFLWVGTWGGALYRLTPDGRVEHYALGEHGLSWVQLGNDQAAVNTLFEDRDGNVWAGTHGMGLHKLVNDPAPGRALVERVYSMRDGLPSGWINSLLQTHDGKLWVATARGLCLAMPTGDAGALKFQIYNSKNGLCDTDIDDLIEDRDGNLWVASKCDLMRVARNGFTGYSITDGLASTHINSIFEDLDGVLTVISRDDARNSRRVINRFDGARFSAIVPNLPSDIGYHGWGGWQTIRQDHMGEWWIPTGSDALFRFPKAEPVEQLASMPPKAVYTSREGLPSTEVFHVYEDARGDVWMGITGMRYGLARWERATNLIHDYTAETGVSPGRDFTGFAEDLQGNLWIGLGEGGGLLRYRDGRFKLFMTDDGVPPGWIIWLYVDRSGRLWIGSQLGGLNRLDDPGAETPQFKRYTTRDGLSSNNIRSITEDLWGRIYVGTGHGVDRLDLETGNVKHYTTADGLPRGIIEQACRDRHGALWFGSPFGLSRLVPEQQESSAPPSIYITGLRVEGVARRVSELGETSLPDLRLASDQTQVSLDFTGLGASLGEELRYQYRLEGAEENWSQPTTERTINYARLAPGSYRFMVRAINANGQVSQMSATLSFTILAPIWQRPWFILLVAAAVGLTVYLLYRYRVTRLLEVANMRTRIATDLHDDIGANLTKIAILSEVARQRFGDAGGPDNTLSSIARISRESVESMSDIVWAINPRSDSLLDLVRRMREHAEEVFALGDINLSFDAPGVEQHMKLGVDVRRDVFLIFKEAVNNAARHADCMRVQVDFHVDESALSLTVADDGKGFDTSIEGDGQGLSSMHRRAQMLGGTLSVESELGRGTVVTLELPLQNLRHR
jgi:ligand-binding sensor domain-containing protein/signal transduction histidine kinase